MQNAFRQEGLWILPHEGTMGNKARNLYVNTPAILSTGFFVPKSLVVPSEYLSEAKNKPEVVWKTIDGYFPGWRRMVVRSNAPDEDAGNRCPGLYESVDVWHEDADYGKGLIEKVIHSYNKQSDQLRRKALCLPEIGMGLLVQEPVSEDIDNFKVPYSGCFSQIGEKSLLTFISDMKIHQLDSMKYSPDSLHYVDESGKITGTAQPHQHDLACRLHQLANALPRQEGKGWELEFVAKKDKEVYVVQTTPIVRSPPLVMPDNLDNLFRAKEFVGIREKRTQGILIAPFLGGCDALSRITSHLVDFDVHHKDYCLITNHLNIARSDRTTNILEYLKNAAVILDIGGGMRATDEHYAPHVMQFMRGGRVAMEGHFMHRMFPTARTLDPDMYLDEKRLRGIQYSPAQLYVSVDEINRKGIVSLVDQNPVTFGFVPVK